LVRTRELERRQKHVLEQVMAVRRTQPRLGTRKLQHMLREPLAQAGIRIGRDTLFEMLRQARLLVVPRRAYHKTTNSHHRFYRHPNLLKDGPLQHRADGSEQIWVADITYLPTESAWVYVSLVKDA
jgi:transposase InsO family protein